MRDSEYVKSSMAKNSETKNSTTIETLKEIEEE